MVKEIFLIGAGFNIEANAYVFGQGRTTGLSAQCMHANAPSWERLLVPSRYPLVGDLRRTCFGPDAPTDVSVEGLFQAAYSLHDWVPLHRLAEIISAGDHYIGAPLAKRGNTAYAAFLESFPEADYLSFNYDSLIEFHLRVRNRWNPCEGFGLHAETKKTRVSSHYSETELASSQIVLHLHGSLCLSPIESDIHSAPPGGLPMLTLREHPRLIFDPESLAGDFAPYQVPDLEPGYIQPVSRFVPPIPGKEEGLEQDYYRILLARAHDLVGVAQRLTAIGYSFAPSDSGSYHDILLKLFKAKKELVIVGPEAEECSVRLSREFETFRPRIRPISVTFGSWVRAGFPGVKS